MQWTHGIHGVLSVLMIAAMGSGRMDCNCAREHHSLWVDEE